MNEKTDSDFDFYVVAQMPNGMYFPFALHDPLKSLEKFSGSKTAFRTISPIMIAHCSERLVGTAEELGAKIKKVSFTIGEAVDIRGKCYEQDF